MPAGYPEHYSIHAAPGRNVTIVETLGDDVCSFLMREWDDSLVKNHELPPRPGRIARHPVRLAGATDAVQRALRADGVLHIVPTFTTLDGAVHADFTELLKQWS